MQFQFTEDQLLLQKTLGDYLRGECTPEALRAQWETDTGRSPQLWAQLAELGVPGLLVPEAHDGLGMNELDLVLLLEETGHAGLAEPIVGTAAVAAPLLASLEGQEVAAKWLPAIAAGEATVAVGHPVNAFTSDAHVAKLLLMPSGDDIHALTPDQVETTHQPCNDPSRRIFSVRFDPTDATRIASGETGRQLQADALDRGALACAAQQLGVTQALIDLGVTYACQRQQFGVPIGSFQAVKHMLADCAVKLEYAKPVVYKAAHSVAHGARGRSVDVSTAKVAASQAAAHTAKVALYVHGALGYTWEQDVHIWMRRAWSLAQAFGNTRFHQNRVAGAVIDEALPADSFGYTPLPA
jgi:alkylation response protein AidB-like acyl-CoA dehydrogenase